MKYRTITARCVDCNTSIVVVEDESSHVWRCGTCGKTPLAERVTSELPAWTFAMRHGHMSLTHNAGSRSELERLNDWVASSAPSRAAFCSVVAMMIASGEDLHADAIELHQRIDERFDMGRYDS